MLNLSLSNQKLITQWKKEHREIVALAGKITEAYNANELDILRQLLENMNELTTDHLMSEDVEFYKFSMLEDSLDEEIKKLIEDFIETFEETKIGLMDFLTEYTLEDAVYEKDFIDTFNTITDVLTKRIAYEESTLYATLEVK